MHYVVMKDLRLTITMNDDQCAIHNHYINYTIGIV